jgi:hypothetical protein
MGHLIGAKKGERRERGGDLRVKPACETDIDTNGRRFAVHLDAVCRTSAHVGKFVLACAGPVYVAADVHL